MLIRNNCAEFFFQQLENVAYDFRVLSANLKNVKKNLLYLI